LTVLNLDCAQQEVVVAAAFQLQADPQAEVISADKLPTQAKFDALKIQALTLELAT
jgi:hypothetical protein